MGCYPITTRNFALFEVTESLGETVGFDDVGRVVDIICCQAERDCDVEVLSHKSLEKFPISKRTAAILEVTAMV